MTTTTQTLQTLAKWPEPVLQYIKITDKTKCYKGLGIPKLYGDLSIRANKSVLPLGVPGVGKTLFIRIIPNFEGTLVKYWDSFTDDQLNNYCGEIMEEDEDSVIDRHFVWKVEEGSVLQPYHKQLIFTICSKLISDHNYTHNPTWFPNLRFKNCKLTMFVAFQPKLLSRICTASLQWSNMSTHRFSKLVMLNPLRDPDNDLPLPEPTTIVGTNFRQKISIDAVTLDKRTVDLSKIRDMYRGQGISSGWRNFFVEDYVKAYTSFKGKYNVTQEDVNEFYSLFSPYLTTYNKLLYAEDMRETPRVRAPELSLLTAIGKSLEPASQEELRKEFHIKSRVLKGNESSKQVSLRHIQNAARPLIGLGLIRKFGKDPVYYELTGWLKASFETYRSILETL